MALSDIKLRSIHGKPYSDSQEVSDADGLSVRISPNGVIRFQYRYRWESKAQLTHTGGVVGTLVQGAITHMNHGGFQLIGNGTNASNRLRYNI